MATRKPLAMKRATNPCEQRAKAAVYRSGGGSELAVVTTQSASEPGQATGVVTAVGTVVRKRAQWYDRPKSCLPLVAVA